jgi:argininosuccinate lyase
MQPNPPETSVGRWLRGPRLAEDRHRFLGALLDINCAHVVMLHERRLLADAGTRALLEANEWIRQDPLRLDAHPGREDLYLTVEAAITSAAGEEAGGQLHIGRSRNDITATMTRMVVRDDAVRLGRLLLDFIGALVTLAAEHARTLMPGYTHLRPGQPTTFGHYLTGVAWALRRDSERLAAARRRADECPMGAAAFAGTGFAIDRERVAALLGFARPVPHTQDAVASRDGVLELLAGLALTASTVARWIEDWYVWSTLEFGFLTLDPAITGGSSIMPQKQNPNVLERIRGKSAHTAAAFVDAILATKGTGFTHSQDISVESVAPFWAAARDMEAMLEVSAELLGSVRVNVSCMRERASSGFAMATEIADALVRTRGVPFRTAHGIVARVVRETVEGDLPVLMGHLNAVGAELGRPLQVTESELRAWVDPETAVARRHSGGPSPEAVVRLQGDLRRWIQTAEDELEQDRHRIVAATAAREQAVQRILAGGPA